MATPSLTLPRTLVNAMLAQAQQSPEAEICGLIGGHQGRALHCYAVSNSASHPDQRYAMDPKGQIDAMRQMRERGEELIAIYHSHPHSAAAPSVIDMLEAQYHDAIYVIVSLNTQGVLELAAFQLRNGSAVPVQTFLE